MYGDMTEHEVAEIYAEAYGELAEDTPQWLLAV